VIGVGRLWRFCGLAIFAAWPWGQSPPQGPPTESSPSVLRVHANLVLVDVSITDHEKPVHGMSRDQFHVFENGAEQAIVSFEEHRAPERQSSAIPRRRLPPDTWTNLPEHAESPAANVLLMDGLNTLAANQMDVRRQMLRYLGQIPPGTQVAVFALGMRLRQLSAFTTDAEVLSAAVNGSAPLSSPVLPQPEEVATQNEFMADIANDFTPGRIVAQMQQFDAEEGAFKTDQRVDMTLEALRDLARYLSAIPGRKNLIWLSGSFPIALDPDSTLESPFSAMRNYAAQVRETSDLLAAARVAVYPVDARGLMHLPSLDAANSSDANQERGSGAGMRPNSSVPTSSIADEKALESTMAERTTMQQIAGATGGKEFFNTNDFAQALASAIEDGSSYYTIGYVPVSKVFDGSFRKLAVRVDNAHLQLAYRRGYFADPPDRPSPHLPGHENLLMAAAMHGAPVATQIVFTARVLPADDALLAGQKLPDDAGAAHVKAPARRYIADMRVNGQDMAFSESNGVHHAQIEFVLVAYDATGKRTNYLDKLYYLDMKEDAFAAAEKDGITARLALDVPAGPASLRLLVYDPIAQRAGSLEILLPRK